MKMDLTDDKPSLSHETEIAKDQPNSALPTSPHKEAFAKRDDNIQSDLRASVNLDRNASLLNLLKDIEETFSENPDSFRNISATFKLSPSIPTVPNDFVLKDACSENSYEALPAHSRSPSIADDSETAEILPTRNGDLNARESPIERSSSDEITWVKPIFRPNIDEDIKSLDIPSSSQDLNPKPQELLSISEKRKLIGKKKWNFADNDETKTPEKPNKTEKKISEETKPKKVSPESTKFSSKFSMKRPTSEPQIGTNYQKEEIPPLVFERRKSGGEKLPTPTKTSPHKDKSKK